MARRTARIKGIEMTGPFFERDPRLTFRQNIRVFMDRVAEVTEHETSRRLATGGREGASSAPRVVGRTRSLSGKRWAVTARISISTVGLSRPEAIRAQAIAAGRHNPSANTRNGVRNVGTTLGAEGRTHGFRDARRVVMSAARDNANRLIEDIN